MVQQIRPSGLEKQGFRNLVYNGDMLVHQRGGSIQVTTSDLRVLDGFGVETRTDSYDATWSQSTTVPAGQGFKYSLKCDVNGTASPSGSGNYLLRHCIEDRHLQHLEAGTANAKDITISFWVRSSKTGTYCFQIRDNPVADHALVEYTISSADTWEHKVITIAGNTSGNMTIIGNAGYDLHWHLAVGPDDQTSATSNAFADNSGNLFKATSNQVNLFDSATAEWYITGVQFEVGNQASEFEHVPFDVQLQRCKRYYQKLTGSYAQHARICNGHYNGDSQFQGACVYPVQMRSTPTLALTTTSSNNSSSAYAVTAGAGVDYIDSLLLYNSNDHSTLLYTGSGTASGTGGQGGNLYVQSTITELALDAEYA